MRFSLKCYYSAFIIVIALASGVLFINGWMQFDKNQTIYCEANFVISNYGLTMPVIASIRLERGAGVLFYDGPVYSGGNRIGILSREVRFNGQRKGSMVTMTGLKINKSTKDDLPQDKAEMILPDFYIKPGASLFYTLRYDENGYFFIRDGVLMFFCRDVAH